MFKNPFSFEGRIRRLEYGLSFIFYFLFLFVITIIVELLGSIGTGLATVFTLAICIPLFWFLLAQGAKRCHDLGHNGAWQIIPFYYWWMIFANGDIGDNEYGPNPKGLNYEFVGEWDADGTVQPIDDVDEDGIIKR